MDEADSLPEMRRLDDPARTGLWRDLDALYLRALLEAQDIRMVKLGLV